MLPAPVWLQGLAETLKLLVAAQVLEVMFVLQLDEAIMSDRKERERGVGGGRIRRKKGKKPDEVDTAFKEADAGALHALMAWGCSSFEHLLQSGHGKPT